MTSGKLSVVDAVVVLLVLVLSVFPGSALLDVADELPLSPASLELVLLGPTVALSELPPAVAALDVVSELVSLIVLTELRLLEVVAAVLELPLGESGELDGVAVLLEAELEAPALEEAVDEVPGIEKLVNVIILKMDELRSDVLGSSEVIDV